MERQRVPSTPCPPPTDTRSQAYYWTPQWQDDERESLDAQANGDVVCFDGDDPTDVVRWLLDVGVVNGP